MPRYRALATGKRRFVVRRESWSDPVVFALWREFFEDEPRGLNEHSVSVEREELPLYLRVEDRNSMAHATEVRLPSLDYRLVSLAFRLGSEWKLRNGVGKHLLRERCVAGFRKSNARDRQFGFPIPTETWFRDALYGTDARSSRKPRGARSGTGTSARSSVISNATGAETFGQRQLFDVTQFSIVELTGGLAQSADAALALRGSLTRPAPGGFCRAMRFLRWLGFTVVALIAVVGGDRTPRHVQQARPPASSFLGNSGPVLPAGANPDPSQGPQGARSSRRGTSKVKQRSDRSQADRAGGSTRGAVGRAAPPGQYPNGRHYVRRYVLRAPEIMDPRSRAGSSPGVAHPQPLQKLAQPRPPGSAAPGGAGNSRCQCATFSLDSPIRCATP